MDRTFSPFVVSTWGRLETAAAVSWKEIVRKGAARLGGKARSAKIQEFHQGLSLALGEGRRKTTPNTSVGHGEWATLHFFVTWDYLSQYHARIYISRIRREF